MRFCHEKDAQNVITGCFFTKNGQNDVTQVKLFIMTVKSLLEVQNTLLLLNIILSVYRTLLAKVFD